MGYRTNRQGKTYYTKKRPSHSGQIVTKDEETKKLRADLKRERERLAKIKRQKVAREKARIKQKAIRHSIDRIRKEQQLLSGLTTNRISPDRANQIREGIKEHGGGEFRLIPGLVG